MEEAKIAVLSVLKKGTTLKNIFLNSPSPSQEDDPILIGRHPDCHIVADHPSISRFHLELRPKASLQKISVTDCASVHGTWVSGKKIQPNVPVELVEGDTVKLGASTRIYRLHWMSLSRAFEMEKPMSPLMEDNEEVFQDDILNEGLVDNIIPESGILIKEEITEHGSCFSSVSSSSPLEGKSEVSENFIENEMQTEKELSLLRLDKNDESSSLLSRRNKSISFLLIEKSGNATGSEIRNDKEGLEIGEKVVGAFAENLEEEKVSTILLAENNLIVEEEEPFVLDKENIITINSIESTTINKSRGVESSPLNSFRLFNKEFFEIEEQKVDLFVRETGGEKICSVFSTESHVKEHNETFISDKDSSTSANSICSKIPLDSPNAFSLEKSSSSLGKENPTTEGKKLLKSNDISSTCCLMMVKEDLNLSNDNDLESSFSPIIKTQRSVFKHKEFLEIEEQKVDLFVRETEREKICSVFSAEDHVKEHNETFISDKDSSTLANSICSKIPLDSPNAFNLEKSPSSLGKENPTIEGKKLLKSNDISSSCRLMMVKKDSNLSNDNDLESSFSSIIKTQRSLFKPEQTSLGEMKVMNVVEANILSEKESLTHKASNSLKTEKGFANGLLKAGIEMDEIFVSDKENFTPQKSMSIKSKKVPSQTHCKIESETKRRTKERTPFQTLFTSSPLRNSSSANHVEDFDEACHGNYNNNAHTSVEKFSNGQHKEQLPKMPASEKKKWYIVVDVGCFLTEESLKSLQLLQGIRSTQLIIPRIVIRELDHLNRCQGMLSKGTKAFSVLKWIEECMVKTSWWIHVQSSLETFPAAPTPPATPRSQLCDGSSVFGAAPSNFTGYSACGSLMEIVSPTAEDHILDCALLFKRIKEDGQLMLLTSSTTLRIKAMAEGLLCETPKEFRESIVNPFSKRFLWADSSPRGSTWSCLEEIGLSESCLKQCAASRGIGKADGELKGLKLILLHGSYYGTANF